MSRFAAIENSVATQIATLAPATFAETRIVAAGMLLATRPTVWPAAFVTVTSAKRTEINTGVAGRTTIIWDVEAGALILANSDGSQLGDARTSAGILVDAVIDGFLNFWPTGFAAGTAPVTPCMPGDVNTVLLDSGQAGLYVALQFKIQTIK